MAHITLDAKTRSEKGKNKVKHLRKQGWVPAVLYGSHSEPKTVSVEAKTLQQIYASKMGRNTIINLHIQGENDKNDQLVLSHVIDKDHIKQSILHVDFLTVSADEAVRVDIPVVLEGTAPGVKMGGQLLHRIRKLTVSCLPKDIPADITLDISTLQTGDNIRVNSIEMDGISFVTHPEEVIVRVASPRGQTVDEEIASEAAESGEASDDSAGSDTSEESNESND